MTIQEESESIFITRIEMEDNMFVRSPRSSIPRIRVESTHSLNGKYHTLARLSNFYIFFSIIIQLVVGVLGNSLTLVTDAARVFADHLEQYEFDRSTSTRKRLTEIITVGVTTIFMFLLTTAFLLLASARAATMDFDINRIFLIIGTAVAMTSNTLQTMQHFRTWKHEDNYVSDLHINSRTNQIVHGFGYHFVAYFVICSSLLIIVTKEYLLADVVNAYIISLLIITNLVSIGFRLFKEYFALDHPQDEYEPL